jgi:predicted tellurium resistance membrane protein TerC
MAVAATFIARLLDRYRWLAWAGLAIILYVAVAMIWEGGWEIEEAIVASVGALLPGVSAA